MFEISGDHLRIKIVFRILAGLVGGYVAYLPLLLVVEYATYGRIDGEKVFYALYYPLEAPYLALPSTWKNTSSSVIVLEVLGGLLLITGVLLAIRGRQRTQPSSSPHSSATRRCTTKK